MSLCCCGWTKCWRRRLKISHAASSSSSSSSLSSIDCSSPTNFSNWHVSEFHIHLICTLNSAISILKSFCGHKNEIIFINVDDLEETREGTFAVKDSRPYQNPRLLRSEHISLLAHLIVLQQCHNTFEKKYVIFILYITGALPILVWLKFLYS